MKDNIIWDSEATYNYIYAADKDELLDDFMGCDEEEYEELVDKDIDEIRDMALDYYSGLVENGLDMDIEQLEEWIIPMIKKQCYNDCFWLVGNYQRWDGGTKAIGFMEEIAEGLLSVCYPSYDSHSWLYEEDGDILFSETNHDAPTGGTSMKLYSFKTPEDWNKAEEYLPDYGVDDYTLYDDATDFELVEKWIEKGLLTPIKNKM